MAKKLEAGVEPIPGYKLVARIGSGGFGEVWKVQAPGGFFKAIKFVAGNLHNKEHASSAAAVQELNALHRVQAIRHPFILSLERYDIVNGQLFIVMELADRSVRHRYKECKAHGLPGIPRDELLRYMEETGEALDLMNVQHGLQHLDIKPANLFLVQNHIKVADFGLVKNQEAMETDNEGGITPDFAAPELWLGGMSRYCDQYSLAICFQELLTGTKPFEATTMRVWKRAHTTFPPNVAPLPAADQPIIARALSKKPKERFPNCLEMVKALRQTSASTTTKTDGPATVPNKLAETTELIEVSCTHCQRRGRVPRSVQGKAVKCPGCGKSFTVPEPPPLDIPDEVGLSPVEGEEVAAIQAGKEPEVLVEAKCPNCGHKGHVPEKFMGRKLRCRKCATAFIVGGPVKVAPKKS
jgi:serine/threonine protein kinase